MLPHDQAADPALPALIELDHATVCRGVTPVLKDVSLRIAQGESVAILGPNGCGKSTFVKLVHRELYPLARVGAPSVRVLGESRWDVFALRRILGIVSPDLQRDLIAAPEWRAIDVVLSGFFASQRAPDNDHVEPVLRAAAHAALARVDAGHLVARTLATMSTGEARRVLIARALAHAPRALLLDEPSSGLDIAARHRLVATLDTLVRDGTTLILVTHHVEEIVAGVDRVILLRDGRVVADGTVAEVVTDANLSALYGMALRVERSGAGMRLVRAPESD